jgi:hypothetical protein
LTDSPNSTDDAFAALEGPGCGLSIACAVSRTRPTPISPRRYHGSPACIRAALTRMDQSLDYRELSAELPSDVGRDGLVIELPDP